MELENIHGNLDKLIRVNGKMVLNMGKECGKENKDNIIKDNLNKVSQMGMEYSYGQTKINTKVNF